MSSNGQKESDVRAEWRAAKCPKPKPELDEGRRHGSDGGHSVSRMKKTLNLRKLLFGGGSILLISTGAALVWSTSHLDGDVEVDRTMRTAAVLNGMGRSLDAWVVLHGQAPAEASSALEDPSVSVTDGWGHALIYKREPGRDGRAFQLRSMGPNAQDDGGEGDDVIYTPVAR